MTLGKRITLSPKACPFVITSIIFSFQSLLTIEKVVHLPLLNAHLIFVVLKSASIVFFIFSL